VRVDAARKLDDLGTWTGRAKGIFSVFQTSTSASG
jgi:hypothetical protein